MLQTMKPRLRKIVDEVTLIRCASGSGIIREEVWVDANGSVKRFNLAFINHFLCKVDHGRVLGYDNSHGHPHRHFKGRSEPVTIDSYAEIRENFIAEAAILRWEKP